ncbi:hypothetical protein M404DRAFT_996540 [Pisolithus tinctorius Marx 270]|uniref:Uncharacterized protein n=1 Tax=Pisolithus tinctorius Marx 270 TaxID=870435 RepID=A0A0C3KJF8_PISTI|nr:hypothetical protein M404DRAFT_996540 [Pisolithus tinctorius Marx 270]
MTDISISTIDFANWPHLSGDVQSSTNGERRFYVHETAVIDIATIPACDETATELQREGEV